VEIVPDVTSSSDILVKIVYACSLLNFTFLFTNSKVKFLCSKTLGI
jgi:hypothetical protein